MGKYIFDKSTLKTIVANQRSFIKNVGLTERKYRIFIILLYILSPDILLKRWKHYLRNICSDIFGEYEANLCMVDAIEKSLGFKTINICINKFWDAWFFCRLGYVPKINAVDTELSIVCIVKNETRYIREWIEFHKVAGVDHIYLFDNGSTDDLQVCINDYINSGYVTVIYFPGKKAQLTAYRLAISQLKAKSQWVVFLDADEFLFPVKESNIKSVLSEYKNYPALGVNWVVYGPCNHVSRPDGLVIQNYTQTFCDRNNNLNLRIKSIVQPKYVIDVPSPHYCVYSNNRNAVDEDGKEITGGNMLKCGCGRALTFENKISKLRINHYWTKSHQELHEKCMRGYPDGSENPEHEKILKRLDYPLMSDTDICAFWNRMNQS